MQPTADWWKVAVDDIRAANEARRDSWHRLVQFVPYRKREELERLERVAMANLPPGQFGVAGFDALVSRYAEQLGRQYIEHGAGGWVPEVIKPEECLVFSGIPAGAVAAAFAHAMCVAQSMQDVRPRGRPGWRAFRCWVGLLVETWCDELHYSPGVTHDTDDDRRGTENEKFGRFHEFVEGWVEWVQRDFAPAEMWWPQKRSNRGHMIDALFKELRGRRQPIKGGPFAAYQQIKISFLGRKSRMIDEQARRARDGGSDCPHCRMLHIDRCRRRAVLGNP
jgi:hypothetical protein